MSDEEIKKRSESQQKRYAKTTPEQRREQTRKAREKHKENFFLLSKEERSLKLKNFQESGTNAMKKKFDLMTSEERKRYLEPWIKIGGEAGRKAVHEKISLMSGEEKVEYLKNWINSGMSAGSINTGPELIFEKLLQLKGFQEHIDYEKQRKIGRFFVDFYLFDYNLVVEIYGCFWHQCEKCGHLSGYKNKTFEEIKKHDDKRIKYFKSLNHHVKIIWEHQLLPTNERSSRNFKAI